MGIWSKSLFEWPAWGKDLQRAENQEIAAKRKTPDLLYTGDEIFIPEFELPKIQAGTGSRHRLRLARRLREFSLRLIEETGQPVADLDFEIHINAYPTQQGTVGSDGIVGFKAPFQSQSALLKLPSITKGWRANCPITKLMDRRETNENHSAHMEQVT